MKITADFKYLHLWDNSSWKYLPEVLHRENVDALLLIQNRVKQLKIQHTVLTFKRTSGWIKGLPKPHEAQQKKLPNSASEEEEAHAPAHAGSLLAGKNLGRKCLGYRWTSNWTWESIRGSVLKNKSILKIFSVFYPVPEVPLVLRPAVSTSYWRVSHQYTHI